jgi:iron complex outermembrane receptor protein
VIRDRCAAGATDLCQFVIRDGSGALNRIINPNLNLNTLITRGWDVEANYSLPLSVFGGNSDADLEFRALATFVKDLITIDTTGLAVDRAGQNGSGVSQPSGLPDYTINAFLTYRANPFSAQLQVRHISAGRFNVTYIGPDEAGYSPLLPNSVSDNKVQAVTYVNLNAQYQLLDNDNASVELFGVINNLFDQDPPNDIPSSFGPTNNVLYDVVGRSFKIGVRFGF